MDGSRRNFILGSGSALTMAALASQARHFGMVSALASSDEGRRVSAARSGSDYKALVCVLLSGGNDGNNTLIPNHYDKYVSNYETYAWPRTASGLAIPQKNLLPIAVPTLGELTYGFHPSFGAVPGLGGINNGIHELWAQGKLAVVANIGNLVSPITKSQYLQDPTLRPYQLFSHSDQVQQQQSSRSNSPSLTGWGGRIADRTGGSSNPAGRVPMITSVAGAQLFTLGANTTPLAIKDAVSPLNEAFVLYADCCGGASTTARQTAMRELRAIDLDSEFVRATSRIMNEAQTAASALTSFEEVTVPFPNTKLGNQFKQVARLIKKRSDLNINRQIFFVELPGFDSHQNQMQGPGSQAILLAQMSQAMLSFYDEMGVQGLRNDVTTFTLSDFGRTMSPSGIGAGVGTDHGWGSHMFVLGGTVVGGNIYGSLRPDGTGEIFPTIVPGGPDDIDDGSSPRGRWLPTTSVEQYAATLGRWFGLTDQDLPIIFPNITNFPVSDLGFMSA